MKYIFGMIILGLAISALFPLGGWVFHSGPEWLLINEGMPAKGCLFSLGILFGFLFLANFIAWTIHSWDDDEEDEKEEIGPYDRKCITFEYDDGTTKDLSINELLQENRRRKANEEDSEVTFI